MNNLFAKIAIDQIPKILTLLDRNQHSPTYGCFDRNYWHYKIIDFPSGMAQEFVLPLALAYSLDIPGNPYYRERILRDWVHAGIRFAAQSAHSDGSCDDYFPYERAGGAAAFSLLACLYSYELMQFDDAELKEFFKRRATWLANHHESGRLTNHQALIVLCLLLTSSMLETKEWQENIRQRLEMVLDWQDEEGWFHEYEGCDPGYDTLTISILAWIYEIHPLPQIRQALKKAVQFVSYFVHPDGSFGGEYTSRNTYNFFPHGFELVGKWLPEATVVNDRIISGLEKGLQSCSADDHIIGHHNWNYLLAWRDYIDERPEPDLNLPEGRTWFPHARLLIERHGENVLYVALNKGGVFKLFRNGKLFASDTQFTVKMKNGRNAVGHLVDDYDFSFADNGLTVQGSLGWAKHTQMSTFKLIVLRLIMLSVGRFFPGMIRSLLQRMLITGKDTAPLKFKREMRWKVDRLEVEDYLIAKVWSDVKDIRIGTDQTSIYVAMSRTYQLGQLQEWIDLTSIDTNRRLDEPLHFKRFL